MLAGAPTNTARQGYPTRTSVRSTARSAGSRIAGQFRRPSERVTRLLAIRVSSNRADRRHLALAGRKTTAT